MAIGHSHVEVHSDRKVIASLYVCQRRRNGPSTPACEDVIKAGIAVLCSFAVLSSEFLVYVWRLTKLYKSMSGRNEPTLGHHHRFRRAELKMTQKEAACQLAPPEESFEQEREKLHAKIGELSVELEFLEEKSRQLGL